MQSIRSHHQVEVLCAVFFEVHLNSLVGLADSFHAVAENGRHSSLDLFEYQSRQRASRQTHKPPVRHSRKGIHWKSRDLFFLAVHNAQSLYLVSFAPDRRQQSHAVRNLKSRAPEVDHVAVGTQLGRLLHYRDFCCPTTSQPIGESWPCDSCS